MRGGFERRWVMNNENAFNFSAATITGGTNRNLKVYLITMDNIDQFWYFVDHGASVMASVTGINYIWAAPDRKNNEMQIEILNNAVADGADLILLAANDPIAISNAIEDAKSKSVKIIYVDSPAYEEAIITLSTDNYNAGRIAGEKMLFELGAVGITSGSIEVIGINRKVNSSINRVAGFRDVIEADGRFLLLPTEYREGDPVASQEAAEDFIINNPDLVGIFASNEGTTVGVGNANKAYNNKVICIGFDQSEPILNLLREGSITAVMVQNPFTMGYLGMAEAYAALRGYDTGPDYIDTGVAILSQG